MPLIGEYEFGHPAADHGQAVEVFGEDGKPGDGEELQALHVRAIPSRPVLE